MTVSQVSNKKFNSLQYLSFKGQYRVLHMTWFTFFLTFMNLLAVAATMACSFFVQVSEGAVLAVKPLVKKRVTGQIAGMIRAYKYVGAVVCMLASLLLKEPKGFFAEAHHDEISFVDSPTPVGATT